MKFVVHAALSLSFALANPVIAAAPAPAPAPAAASVAANSAAHVKVVQDLLAAMQAEKVLRGVAARSRYQSEAQRQAVFAKLGKTPPAEVYRRLAPPLARAISADTAIEMTRFYNTPYGKQVVHNKYNSASQIMMPGRMQAQERQHRGGLVCLEADVVAGTDEHGQRTSC